MGTPEDRDGGGSDVGGGLGTIVWVRRRNGSWWPGRILGAEELSTSHLLSPRSGTPVKLLGREDASVDWYNLEKSKRVKPFRCGEFDSCIQKAEASQGGPIKKREKYARREDAILHALELERKFKMKQHKSGVHVKRIIHKSSGQKRGSNFLTSDTFLKNEDSGVRGKSAICNLRKEDLLHEENTSNSADVCNEKTGKPTRLDRDISETMPHMKELHDFGPQNSLKKNLLYGVCENSQNSKPNNMERYPIMGLADYVNGRNSAIMTKRKRSCATAEESLGKKLGQQHPTALDFQASVELQSSGGLQFNQDSHIMPWQEKQDDTNVSYRMKRCRDIYLPVDLSDSPYDGGYSFKERHVPSTLSEMDSYFNKPTFLTKENASGMIEAYESDSSETEHLVSNMEQTDLLDDTGGSTLLGSRNHDSAIFQVPNEINVNPSQMPLHSSILQGHLHEHCEDISAELGFFRWHIKGKRNSRNVSRRSYDLTDEVFMHSYKCDDSLRGTSLEAKVHNLKIGKMNPSSRQTLGRGSNYYRKDIDYTPNKFDLVGDTSDEDALIGYDKQNLALDPLINNGESHTIYEGLKNDTCEGILSGWEADGGYMVVLTPYWNDNNDAFYTSYPSQRIGSTLINIDVEVQRGYQGERVPLVSLMSRLNGKAIIGHPIQVEILEDGSTNQYFPSYCVGLDESRSTYPVQKTSMLRVLHSYSGASLMEGGENARGFEFPDQDIKPAIKKYSGHFSYQSRLAKKSYHHACQHQQEKYQKSKGVRFSSQRTAPCAIVTKHKLGNKNHDSKLTSSHGILGSLKGADGIMPPVTCVPVKVAFSRILEAVGRPSSVLAHRIQVTTRALRHP